MNHYVPDFEIQMDDDEEFPIPISKKRSVQNDEIMELLWQNGPVVMQSQNQRPFKKTPAGVTNTADGAIPAREIRSSVEENYSNQHLFMQEDEMASWLHYPIDEDPPFDHHEFCADLLCPSPLPVVVSAGQNQNSSMQAAARTAAPRPPIPPARKQEQAANGIQNFAYFSKYNNARTEPGPSSSSKAAAAQSTVVDSCDTPVATAVTASRVSETVRSSAEHAETGRGSTSSAGKAGPSTAVCDMTVTSSPGCSSGSAEPSQREPVVDRKRKGLEPEESEFLSEDVDFESPEAKKQIRGSTSAKRSRAAEVHNLSERRRRDRINEKMRALQELIPRCNKSDKASMLDEAIEYLKSLQLQVQMMSMGCGMVPMMFPGIQQYMPPPMGMGIGMGMGMEMGMNRPVMPFPNMLAAGSTLPTAATAAAHLGPRFLMPPFHMPHIPTPDPSRMQPPTHSDNILTSVGTLNPDQSRIPNFPDPYQQYLNTHHQVQLQLMQAMNQQNVNKPSTSRGQENPEKHQSEET